MKHMASIQAFNCTVNMNTIIIFVMLSVLFSNVASYRFGTGTKISTSYLFPSKRVVVPSPPRTLAYADHHQLTHANPPSPPFSLHHPTHSFPTKDCRNCKYFMSHMFDDTFATCAKFVWEDDLNDDNDDDTDVDSRFNQHPYCSSARKYDELCGSQGKYFEPNVSPPTH